MNPDNREDYRQYLLQQDEPEEMMGYLFQSRSHAYLVEHYPTDDPTNITPLFAISGSEEREKAIAELENRDAQIETLSLRNDELDTENGRLMDQIQVLQKGELISKPVYIANQRGILQCPHTRTGKKLSLAGQTWDELAHPLTGAKKFYLIVELPDGRTIGTLSKVEVPGLSV
jgi:hypothetical protein